MPAVLETGLDFIESDNETNLPCVKGYNIINGQLKVASEQKTFESIDNISLKASVPGCIQSK